MTYKVDTTRQVDKVASKWKKSNPILFRKYGQILHDIADHPTIGIGHPEALLGGKGITYSRHISAHNRIIYDVYESEVRVLVIEIEGHYDDK